ncbi:DUF1266 domain-containing protein [Kluyvera georgiana]|uniref:DUF1266 domain-containing protein n=1 Tax=Kluyvera georgiana TaxID=73098 RepID=UPI0008070D79|nr:DUF1266 domain-containing protein [Kluyvera georgiana]
MWVKKFRPLIALIIFLFAQWQFNFVENKATFYIIVGILALYSLFELAKYLIILRGRKETPVFNISKLYNQNSIHSLNSDNEKRAAYSEALYLITETSGNTVGSTYINSLEQLNINNAEIIKDAKLSLDVSWEIDNDKSLRKVLRKLIANAESCSTIHMDIIENKDRYIKYLQSYGLSFPHIDSIPVTGFDLVRASWLTRISFSIGYIDENETREYLNAIGELLQQQFTSWEQLSASYLIMYLEWNGQLNGILGSVMEYSAKERVLGTKTLLEDSESPFHSLPFQC